LNRFSGKIAIVTGAAQGIGQACALAFASEGAAVALVDIREDLIEQVADQIRNEGGQAQAVSCDVSKSDEIRSVVDQVTKTFGKIDILVNNAGIMRTTSPLEEITEEEWDLVIGVNLKSMFLFARAVLPIMRGNRFGKIINISSSAGRSTSEFCGAHYTVSKTGVLGLTRHMAREYGHYGINVNSVCPAVVDTQNLREELKKKENLQTILDALLPTIPLRRLGKSEEVADLVLFLASQQASYLTGATIDFTGGSLLL